MRASTIPGLELALPAALLLLSGTGCSKEVKADFPRPPVTASVKPPPVSAPEDEAPGDDAEDAPVDAAAEPEPESEPLPSKPPAPPPRPRPATESNDGPKPAEVPVAPPSTQLAGASAVDPTLAAKMDRANTLLGSISIRTLTVVQTEQLTAARAFVSQARRALEEGDPRRALVLVDKGLILAEDVERLSRP